MIGQLIGIYDVAELFAKCWPACARVSQSAERSGSQ
jgi:hypothetical protein